MRVLFIIDAQNDFCTKGGSLVCEKSKSVVKNICELLRKIKFDKIVCTLDTHDNRYLNTKEGQYLPVKHCVKGTWGHKLNREIYSQLYDCEYTTVEKGGFMLGDIDGIIEHDDKCSIVPNIEIYVCGFATDICVLNNALMLKAKFPQCDVFLIESCCGGTTQDNHNKAVSIMGINQVNIIRKSVGKWYSDEVIEKQRGDLEKYDVYDNEDGTPVCKEIIERMLGCAIRSDVWKTVVEVAADRKHSRFIPRVLTAMRTLSDANDEDILFPIVEYAMKSDESEWQETAIGVIEEWRTKRCADLLEKVIASGNMGNLMKEYAGKVLLELKEEQGGDTCLNKTCSFNLCNTCQMQRKKGEVCWNRITEEEKKENN